MTPTVMCLCCVVPAVISYTTSGLGSVFTFFKLTGQSIRSQGSTRSLVDLSVPVEHSNVREWHSMWVREQVVAVSMVFVRKAVNCLFMFCVLYGSGSNNGGLVLLWVFEEEYWVSLTNVIPAFFVGFYFSFFIFPSCLLRFSPFVHLFGCQRSCIPWVQGS